MSSGRHGNLRVILILVGLALSACSLPEGDQTTPSQLHYKWIKVRAAGDIEGMWGLLHPDVREEFERWLTAERIIVHEIKAAYPQEDADRAFAAIGGPARAEAASPMALFESFLSPSPDEPGFLGAIAAHVRSEDVSEDGATATVRTFGGDELQFAKGPDDLWYATLPADEAVRLKNARTRAEQNLTRVKSNLEKLGRNKPR